MLAYGASLTVLLIAYTWLTGSTVLDPLLRWNAAGTGSLVRLLGFDAVVDGNRVLSDAFSLVIVPECTSLAAQAIMAAGMLATPGKGFRDRLLGIALGGLALSALNLVRTASLYYIGARHPAALPIAHELVWQAGMVLAALALWAVWARPFLGRPARA
jgi:exosortase/archaeosortase family protein